VIFLPPPAPGGADYEGDSPPVTLPTEVFGVPVHPVLSHLPLGAAVFAAVAAVAAFLGPARRKTAWLGGRPSFSSPPS